MMRPPHTARRTPGERAPVGRLDGRQRPRPRSRSAARSRSVSRSANRAARPPMRVGKIARRSSPISPSSVRSRSLSRLTAQSTRTPARIAKVAWHRSPTSPRSPISPRSASPRSASPLSASPRLVPQTKANETIRSPIREVATYRRSLPLRRASNRAVQRGVPARSPGHHRWDLELRRWCLSRQMRRLRSIAWRMLLALTVACVLFAIILHIDLPESFVQFTSESGAEMACPANSVLQNDRCFATEVECPHGSVRVENRCIALEVSCPEGSERLGELCVVSTENKSLHYAAAERLACSSVGVLGVYVTLISIAGAGVVVAWRIRPRPQRYRCLLDAAMTAERDFLPAQYGNMATLATVGHIRQGEIVTVKRLDTSSPTQQRRAQLDNGYWVSLVSQQGERLFQRINDAETAAEAAAIDGGYTTAGNCDDAWEEGGGRGGGISLFATYPAGVCQVRLHLQDLRSDQDRLAARRATFGANMGNLFGATCVLPRARHAELELNPLPVDSADGRRRATVVAVVYRCNFVSCVEQARRVQGAGAAGLILVNEYEGQAPPDWRPSGVRGTMQRRLRAWSLPWSQTRDGFPGDIAIPVMSVDPADGELLTRAVLRPGSSNNQESSGYGPQSFVRSVLNAVGDNSDNDEGNGGVVATVDMLEIPPKLQLHPRYRREWRLAPGSSVQLERADAAATQDEHYVDRTGDESVDRMDSYMNYSKHDYLDDAEVAPREERRDVSEGREAVFEAHTREQGRGQLVGVTLNC